MQIQQINDEKIIFINFLAIMFGFEAYYAEIIVLSGNMGANAIKIIIIQFYTTSQIPMFTASPYSDEENQQQRNIFNCSDYLSPSPSPQPNSNHLQFTQRNTPSASIQNGTPTSPVIKGGRRGRKSSQQLKNVNRGHWSTQENKKYHWFLQIHFAHFVNRHMRRMDKIFKTMELFIGTRQAEQCRSHHQKMEKKYINFATIITNLRKLHYNTLQTEPMLSELEANGINVFDGLASMSYLLEQQSVDPSFWEMKERKRSLSQKAQKQEAKEMNEDDRIELHKIEEEKWDQVSNHHRINMLEDENINIGQLSLIHEKEENSSIFNSIFM